MRLEFVPQQREEEAVEKGPGQEQQRAADRPQGHQRPQQVEQHEEQQRAVAGQRPQAEAGPAAALQRPPRHYALGEPRGGRALQVVAPQTAQEARPGAQRRHVAAELQREGGVQSISWKFSNGKPCCTVSERNISTTPKVYHLSCAGQWNVRINAAAILVTT